MSVGTMHADHGGRGEAFGDRHADFAGELDGAAGFGHKCGDMIVSEWTAGAAQFFCTGNFDAGAN